MFIFLLLPYTACDIILSVEEAVVMSEAKDKIKVFDDKQDFNEVFK